MIQLKKSCQVLAAFFLFPFKKMLLQMVYLRKLLTVIVLQVFV